MLKDAEGNKVTAKNKAKLVLQDYISKFSLEEHCEDYDDMKRTEPTKVQAQLDKIIERLNKVLVIK
jgi:hypothetical protein